VRQSEDVVARLLSGHEVVVKSSVDLATSERYVGALRAIGVASRSTVETLQLDGDLAGLLDAAASVVAPFSTETTKNPLVEPALSSEAKTASESHREAVEPSAVTTSRGVRYVGFWPRALAYSIDFVILVVTGFCLLFAIRFAMGYLAAPARISDLEWQWVSLTVWALLTYGYLAGSESSRHGATIGKMLIGARVVDLDGHRLNFWRSVWRQCAKGALWFGYFAVGFSERKQALHDMAAKTLVVKSDSVPQPASPPNKMGAVNQWLVIAGLGFVLVLPVALIVSGPESGSGNSQSIPAVQATIALPPSATKNITVSDAEFSGRSLKLTVHNGNPDWTVTNLTIIFFETEGRPGTVLPAPAMPPEGTRGTSFELENPIASYGKTTMSLNLDASKAYQWVLYGLRGSRPENVETQRTPH
jgi:uncharacterized RDD family membrane protein YckC